MSLRDQILEDIKTAMKAKQEVKLMTLRGLNSAIKNREIEMRPEPITETEIQGVLKKAIKQRKEAIEQFETAKREDLVAKESEELAVLEGYLPAQLSAEKVAEIVKAVIQETGAQSMKDMRQVMPEVVARTGGAADTKLISDLVKSQLSGN